MRNFSNHSSDSRIVFCSTVLFNLERPNAFATAFCLAFAPIVDFTRVIFNLSANAIPPYPNNSSNDLPRNFATSEGSLILFNPSIVAFTTLRLLLEPRDFVLIFRTPANSRTARTGPPAITPVPSGAGFNSTLELPNFQ